MELLKKLQLLCKDTIPKVEDLEESFFEHAPKIDVSNLGRSALFDSERYSRNLLAAQEHFSLMLLCWEPGQQTPVHRVTFVQMNVACY